MPLTIRRRLVDRVRQLRKIAYAVCVALVVFSAAIVFLSISSPASTVEVSIGPTFFDSNRAYRDAADVTNFLQEQFKAFGSPVVQSFQAPLGDREVTLRNVAIVLPGKGDAIL